LRPPHFLDSGLTDGGEVDRTSAPAALYLTGRFLVLISVRGRVDPRAIVRLEGSGELKKKINDLIGNRTRYFSACSIVSQPTTEEKYEKPQS
jgi:hypothetical protein